MADRKTPSTTDELRREAKERFLRQRSSAATALTPSETQELVQELEIHQIELELQNEQLNAVRAQLEMALDQTTALYDFAPVGSLTLDQTGIITKLNLAGARLLGSERARLLGSRFGLFVSDAERPAFIALFDQAMTSGDVQSGEISISGPGVPAVHVQIKIAPIPEALGCQVSLVDITERRKAEVELRIAATAFESQEGMMITDAKTVILRVNRAFTETTGYTAEEAVGQTPRLLQSGRHNKDFYRAMWETIRRTGRWQGEIWDRRKNGEIHPQWLTITAVKSDNGTVTHYVGTHADITERKAAADEIMHLAYYDLLTQLANRRLLLDRLQQALASSARSGRNGALLFVDLDNFKTLNDTLGHDRGDLLLQQVAQRLATCVREGDTVARLGGDEFVVMLEGLSEHRDEAATQAEILGEEILATLNQPYLLAGRECHSTPSIGVTLFSGHQTAIEELLKQADLAMYQSKTAGRNTLRFFDPKMQAMVTDRAALEIDLREAVRQQQFVLHYQPQVVGEGRLTGAEALVRWQHPVRGLVYPNDFIPLAEETGLILPLGLWVLETACVQLARWATQPDMADLSLAINVSANQLHQTDFVDQVLAALGKTGANPHRLKLELTESLLLSNVENSIAKMVALKAHGVGFSLDDFGTGYSSLSYLQRLPLDQLKIDRNFVRDIPIDTYDVAIAKMILALAESLGLTVIAEGVETEAQRDFLASQGCHAYQGYLFGRPLPLDEFEESVRRV